MIQCEQCRKKINELQLVGLILKGNKILRLCPTCYKIVHDKEVENINVTREEITKMDLNFTYKSNDIKNFLKSWSKDQINTI